MADDRLVTDVRSGDEREATCATHGAYVAHRLFRDKWSACQMCVDIAAEREREEEKTRRHAEWVREAFSESGIVGRYLQATFESFETATPIQRRALSTCEDFVRDFARDSGRTLILIGPPGTGKTHLACAIGIALIHREILARFVTGTEIVREVRATWKRDGMTEQQAIDALAAPSLLIIDEVALVTASENENRILFDVVDTRSRYGRPIVVTSNATWPELQVAVGDRIADRLAENATVVPLTGESYRRRCA